MPFPPFARRAFAPLAFALIALALAGGHPAVAEPPVVRLTSLDWPPFSGESLKDKGAAVAVVQAAFAAEGHKVEVAFFPWNRAVAMVKDGGGYDGYFPEYDSPEVRDGFVLSVPLGSSPLGLAERVATPLSWTTLNDLKGKRIGVVDGYVNTVEFDQMMASGALTTDKAKDDLINLRKLLAGRVEAAVIDQAVMNDLLRGELKADAAKIRFNPRPLEDKTLHIAFRKDAQGQAMAKIFAAGLAKIDAKLILQQQLGS